MSNEADQQIEEAAFLAEMMDDGEPPAQEAEALANEAAVEAKQEDHAPEPERVEVFAGYTEQEVKAALEKVNETDALRAELAQVRKGLETANGTYGNKLAQLQKTIETFAAQSTAFEPEDFAELAQEFGMPELTDAIVKGLNKKLKTAAKSETSADQSEAVEKLVSERMKPVEEKVAQTERKLELKALSMVHPDWQSVVKEPEFGAWAKTSLTPDQFGELSDSWDSDLVSSRLTEFKAHREAQTKAASTINTRLQAAVEHRGNGGKPPRQSAIDEEEEAFRREMAS